MKKYFAKTTAVLLSASMAFSWAGSPVLAEEDQQSSAEDVTGTLAFAQCDEYVNIRSSAGTDGDITGKIYNDCAATIVGEENGWYEITSGNARGYVSADYFATGEEAQAISDRVGYDVAIVHPEALMVRTSPDESSEVMDIAQQSEELEVVDWNGDWMKVALGGDSYGYVNAYYVAYDTYYPVAETVEEEQHRLASVQKAESTATAQTETVYEESTYEEPTYEESTYEEPTYEEPTYEEPTYEEPTYEEPTYEEPTYEEPTYEEPTYEEPTYEEPTYEEPTYEEPTYEEPTYEEPTYEEPTYEEPTYEEPTYEEPTYEEPTYEEPTYEEPTYEESTDEESSYSLGQQIADYAVQFVGNPYVYGGTSLTNGADCSGFTQSVFANFGIYLSRTAESQSYGGTSVDLGSLQPGDLLFYSDGGYVGHVALYIGGGQIVHASTPESGIIISNYDYSTPSSASRYW